MREGGREEGGGEGDIWGGAEMYNEMVEGLVYEIVGEINSLTR